MADMPSIVARAIVKAANTQVPNNIALAEAAIAAHEEALEAEGLVIVPRKPNASMIFAGQEPQHTLTGYDNIHLTERSVEKRYKAMLAALEGKNG